MSRIVYIVDKTDEKVKRMVWHPRILQRLEATSFPRTGRDRGRRWSCKSAEVGALGWDPEPGEAP